MPRSRRRRVIGACDRCSRRRCGRRGAPITRRATVTLVVPFPPGGGVDAMARVVAAKLSEAMQAAIRRRQPGRRRRHDRHPRGRAGRARRLHATARTHRHHLDQSRVSTPMPATIRARTSRRSGLWPRCRWRCSRIRRSRRNRSPSSSPWPRKIPANSISALRRSAPAATCAPNCSNPRPASTLRSFHTKARLR